ncbi:diacylglycerol acyltransferase-domain-containing protein [Pelagophyceae sp. CCMP2097]|nr:diacylglycerol acyltransferase-domain-containing protein [Pelagophyceae sp. CCMP2097]|mmetsp:Transcript_97/g.398  ORF Transcript_97/g.398 Transcript_97/m.398 type:complete len:350 (+) Transcript_97:51-1100(+)|eukprot:CAMPEP_0206811528 /NCGR_PEP_ID=MMETSP0975-20121206/7303_1 /ASSEMBLY_ACC=CAM_ASM_000399 /TAXON_ID=483370 /ORGANISM="non described non described, Strain CCMP2097" /LENGTH=349 /DNA_ID=CAMNT_0054353651 /DNA_START=40 /DNA_END=1089 /DNA_ORIENTATION=+
MCNAPASRRLTKPTHAYLESTWLERTVGFAAASVFTLTYVLAPAYLALTAGVLLSRCTHGTKALWLSPALLSYAVPASLLPSLGTFVLQSWPFRQMCKYFAFESYLEIKDDQVAKLSAAGKRFILCFHPHGIFPFCACCALTSALGAPDDAGALTDCAPDLDTIIRTWPTAVATVLLHMPILKDVVGLFGVIGASAPVLNKWLRKKSCGLYVGGMLEMFHCSAKTEGVVLKSRKGFVKLALRTGADLIPTFQFGNTEVLSAVTAGPLAWASRKVGVSLTVFWGRWGLPLPRRKKMVYVRGFPLGLPHIPEPTDEDVDKWHAVYCDELKALYDHYKQFNPDYAHKPLVLH